MTVICAKLREFRGISSEWVMETWREASGRKKRAAQVAARRQCALPENASYDASTRAGHAWISREASSKRGRWKWSSEQRRLHSSHTGPGPQGASTCYLIKGSSGSPCIFAVHISTCTKCRRRFVSELSAAGLSKGQRRFGDNAVGARYCPRSVVVVSRRWGGRLGRWADEIAQEVRWGGVEDLLADFAHNLHVEPVGVAARRARSLALLLIGYPPRHGARHGRPPPPRRRRRPFERRALERCRHFRHVVNAERRFHEQWGHGNLLGVKDARRFFAKRHGSLWQ